MLLHSDEEEGLADVPERPSLYQQKEMCEF